MKAADAKRIGGLSLLALLLATIPVIISDASPAMTEQSVAGSTSSDEVAAASGSNRFVVWIDETPGNSDIFFRRSTDDGATWMPTVNLSTNPGTSFQPQIAVSGTNIHVVWSQENSQNTSTDVFIRSSANNGATWGGKVNLSMSGKATGQEISVSGSNVYVVWTGQNGEIYFRRSIDNGATWKPIVNLSNNFRQSFDPDIAVSGSSVYVVWTNWGYPGALQVFFKRSLDGGATWQANVNISQSPEKTRGAEIASSGSNVNVVWEDLSCEDVGGNCEIRFRGSANGGATWMPVKNLSNTPEISFFPQLAASGSNVYLVWVDKLVVRDIGAFDEGEIFFRRSTDGGVTWKTVVNLSNNPGDSRDPKLAISGSNVYVVWDQPNEERTAIDSFFRRSTDNGATFKSKVNLSNTGHAGSSDVAVSGSNVYVAYHSGPGNQEVFFQRSTDNGATWGSAKNLSNNAGSSREPQVAA